MDCEEARELLDEHALGLLEARPRRRLEGHLSRCEDCQSLSREAAEAAGRVALAVPLRRASPALLARLLSRINTANGGRRGWPPRAWAAAAAALLVMSLGALGWSLFLQDRVSDLEDDNSRLTSLVFEGEQAQVSLVATQEAILAQQQEVRTVLEEQDVMLAATLDKEARHFQIRGTGHAAQAGASYVWSHHYHLGILFAADLPPPPPGMVYQLWFVTEERSISGGTFAPDEEGVARLVVHDPPVAEPVVAIEVSLEPEGGGDVRSGAPVLRGEPSLSEQP